MRPNQAVVEAVAKRIGITGHVRRAVIRANSGAFCCTRSRATGAARQAASGARGRQPEGRRRQDHDGDQSRHRARRDRRGSAHHRSRSAGQCLDRARHRPPQSAALDLRCSDWRSDAARCHRRDRGAAAASGAVDTRSLRARARNRPGARSRLPLAQCARAAEHASRPARPNSPTCWSTVRRRSIS